MSNERKTWSVKDNDYVWDKYLEGMSNEGIAEHVGRTPIAVGVRISKLKTRYGFTKPTISTAGTKTGRIPTGKKVLVTPTLTRTLLASFIGACAGILVGAAILHFYG